MTLHKESETLHRIRNKVAPAAVLQAISARHTKIKLNYTVFEEGQTRKSWLRFVAIDYLIFFYILLTFALMILYHKRLDDPLPHVLFRFGVVALIFILMWLYHRFPGNITAFLRYAYPLAIISYFYSETEYFNHLFFQNLDPYFASLEQTIFGFQPSLEFSAIIPYKWFSEMMYLGYFSYYFFTFFICFAIYIARIDVFQKVTFVIVYAFILYYIIFIILPVVGPQYYFPYPQNQVPAQGFFGSLVKFIQSMAERPTAAFPSAHVGIGIIFLYFAVVYLPRLAPFMVFFFCILCFATIYIKAHYMIDVMAGLVFGPLLGFTGSRIYRFMHIVRLNAAES